MSSPTFNTALAAPDLAALKKEELDGLASKLRYAIKLRETETEAPDGYYTFTAGLSTLLMGLFERHTKKLREQERSNPNGEAAPQESRNKPWMDDLPGELLAISREETTRAMQVISQKDEELRSVAPVRHAPPSRPPRAHRLKSRARQNRAQPSGGIGRGTCTGADRARTAGGARDGALSIAHDPIRVERGHRCEDTHPRRRRRRTPSWRAQHAPHQIRRSPSPSARLSAMKLSGQVFSCVTARTAVHLAGK